MKVAQGGLHVGAGREEANRCDESPPPAAATAVVRHLEAGRFLQLSQPKKSLSSYVESAQSPGGPVCQCASHPARRVASRSTDQREFAAEGFCCRTPVSRSVSAASSTESRGQKGRAAGAGGGKETAMANDDNTRRQRQGSLYNEQDRTRADGRAQRGLQRRAAVGTRLMRRLHQGHSLGRGGSMTP